MTSSNGNIFRVTGPLCGEFTGPGESPTQRPVTRSSDVFFDLRLNKRLSKQPCSWWFETPSWSWWRQCNDISRIMHTVHVVFYCGLVLIGITHYDDVIMTTIASQITSLTVVYSIVYSDADERKHQSSASLAFVWGIQRDRWIPRTKGQLRGKCFHLMTSSCYAIQVSFTDNEGNCIIVLASNDYSRNPL